ncbi:MAG: hypothetical protein LBM18_01035 [Oscillospiraceae bacterium]|jgi:hypothetical protein|nr:hypothetical protein [Oscillospiraceae bacterium]
MSEFKVEIMRPGQFGVSTSAELELPAVLSIRLPSPRRARSPTRKSESRSATCRERVGLSLAEEKEA